MANDFPNTVAAAGEAGGETRCGHRQDEEGMRRTTTTDDGKSGENLSSLWMR